jgi:heat shock protein HslJ
MTRGQPRIRPTILWFVACLALLALTACGDDSADATGGGDDNSGSPDGAGDDLGQTLVGREYVSTSVTKGGEAYPLVPGTQVRLGFGTDQITAQAGCNTLSGTASWDGATLVVENLGGTEMGCGEALMAQDSWLAGILTSSPTVSADGDKLTLDSGDYRLSFLDRRTAIPDVPLEGTRWVLDGLGQGSGDDGTVASVPDGVRSTLVIEDGQVGLKPGCNTGGGSVEIGDGTLTFGAIMTTQMFCGGAKSEVEGVVLEVLQDTVDYSVTENTLTISHGGQTLIYLAAPR